MRENFKEKKVLICVPCGSGFMSAKMVESLMEITKPCPAQLFIVERTGVSKARNNFFAEALRLGFDYVFMVDDDNPVPHDTLIKMLEADKDVVSAAILARHENEAGGHDLCAFYQYEAMNDGVAVPVFKAITAWRDVSSDSSLHEVDAVGAGCLLIKREVIEAVMAKYGGRAFEHVVRKYATPLIFDEREYGILEYGEDVDFSMKARACGFSLFVDDSIRPLHFTEPVGVVFDGFQ